MVEAMRTIKRSGVQAGSDQARHKLSNPPESLPALYIRTRGGGLLCCPFTPQKRALRPEDAAAVVLFTKTVHRYGEALALLAIAWIYADRIEPLSERPQPEWTKRYVNDHHVVAV